MEMLKIVKVLETTMGDFKEEDIVSIFCGDFTYEGRIVYFSDDHLRLDLSRLFNASAFNVKYSDIIRMCVLPGEGDV